MLEPFSLQDDRTVQIERVLPGPLERLWAYLTRAEHLRTWLADGDVPPQVGARVALSQQHDSVPIRTGGVIVGTVTRVEAPTLLEYTWTHQTDATTTTAPIPSLVRFELQTRGDDVLLRITHGRLRLEDQALVATGWHTHMGILEELLFGRIPTPFLETFSPALKVFTVELERQRQVHALYRALLNAWNARDAQQYAAVFLEDANVIGFDGSSMRGRWEIATQLGTIFAHHQTATYIAKVRHVQFIESDVAILNAVVGMIPPGRTDINPAVNAVQTLIAKLEGDGWRIASFQNTPAAFHGRPELGEALSAELRQRLAQDLSLEPSHANEGREAP
ncbi:MAG: SgcJ/EcaC family oxidoreductase [Pleurocapsa sp. SU_196_0]|nr:SgcJ/EcaC family oxidoreductase [Pleurocapsa sp. SU_196_0]